jgi:hypothetical protein
MKTLASLRFAVLLLIGLASCSEERKEVNRHISPNQQLVAVLMESATSGAARLVQEDIYLNDQGIPLNLDKPVFRGTGCERLSFEWANDYTLQIHYETTCSISQFTNRWFRPSDVAAGHPVPVEIILIRL